MNSKGFVFLFSIFNKVFQGLEDNKNNVTQLANTYGLQVLLTWFQILALIQLPIFVSKFVYMELPKWCHQHKSIQV